MISSQCRDNFHRHPFNVLVNIVSLFHKLVKSLRGLQRLHKPTIIGGDTTEAELCRLFSSYGNVKSTKIIVDRAGVSKGYGFVTFETEHEAQKLQNDCDCIVLRDRKLNIAPAIKKQTICATNGAVYYAATPPTPAINNIPIEQFATVYPPGVPTMYPPTLPYQPFYQYYSVPMVPNAFPPQNVPTIWPQNYQGIYPC